MAGLSFGEIVVLLVIAVVVVGPRQLPTLLRTIGEVIGRTRRLASNLRAESGIDEILRDEGIQSEIDNFRRLAAGGVSLEDDPYLTLDEKKDEISANGVVAAPPAPLPNDAVTPANAVSVEASGAPPNLSDVPVSATTTAAPPAPETRLAAATPGPSDTTIPTSMAPGVNGALAETGTPPAPRDWS